MSRPDKAGMDPELRITLVSLSAFFCLILTHLFLSPMQLPLYPNIVKH